MSYLTHIMASAKTKLKNDGVAIHTLTLTPDTKQILEGLSRDATDYGGRKVSGSAIVRALLRYAKQQEYSWVISQLCPLVEAEQAGGIIWGKKK